MQTPGQDEPGRVEQKALSASQPVKDKGSIDVEGNGAEEQAPSVDSV